jgi:hypothetical protein
MKEVLAALTAELRRSPHVNHRSGVSVRYSIGNLETLSAAAIRRAARTGEPEAVPRVCDLPAVMDASLGRIEFDTIEEGREEEILSRALRQAILDVFRHRCRADPTVPKRRLAGSTSRRRPDPGTTLWTLGDVPGCETAPRLASGGEPKWRARSNSPRRDRIVTPSQRDERGGVARYGAPGRLVTPPDME